MISTGKCYLNYVFISLTITNGVKLVLTYGGASDLQNVLEKFFQHPSSNGFTPCLNFPVT